MFVLCVVFIIKRLEFKFDRRIYVWFHSSLWYIFSENAKKGTINKSDQVLTLDRVVHPMPLDAGPIDSVQINFSDKFIYSIVNMQCP